MDPFLEMKRQAVTRLGEMLASGQVELSLLRPSGAAISDAGGSMIKEDKRSPLTFPLVGICVARRKDKWPGARSNRRPSDFQS